MSEENVPTMAPGLLQAYAPDEADEKPDPRRRRRNQDDPIANLRKWEPRTRLGAAVMAGKIITYEVQNQKMDVVAIGPPPTLDPQSLRDELDARGYPEVDLVLNLVVGGQRELPGTNSAIESELTSIP